MNRSIRGFALLEILVYISIMGMIAMAAVKKAELDSTKAVANGFVDHYHRLQRASMRHYRDTDTWPVSGAALVAGGYITAGEEVDAWGNTFSFTLVGDDLQISTDLREDRYVSLARGKLPRPTITGTVLASMIDPPGDEAAHDMLYARDGSRALTGNMNVNNNNINNANQVNAEQVTANVDMSAPVYRDQDDPTNFYIDPNGTSSTNVNYSNQEHSRIYYDRDNTGYYGDFSGTSRVNSVVANSMRLVVNQNIGWGCATGSLGRTPNGTALNCVNGIWREMGAPMRGTVCGQAVSGCVTQQSLNNQHWCNGHNPRHSCPSGWVSKQTLEGNACGIQVIYRCYKT